MSYNFTPSYPTNTLGHICYVTDVRKRKYVKVLMGMATRESYQLCRKIEHAVRTDTNVVLEKPEIDLLWKVARKLGKVLDNEMA